MAKRRKARPRFRIVKNKSGKGWCIVKGVRKVKFQCFRKKANAKKMFSKICGSVKARRRKR
jgi:hypothetical protein